jgi:hypothetical protein
MSLSSDGAVALKASLVLVALLTTMACPNRQESPVSALELPGRYILRGVTDRHDALELKSDGTYTRISGSSPGVMSGGTWIALSIGKGIRVALSDFVMPIARGPVEWVPIVARLHGKIVIWVDQDTELYYQRDYF